MTTSLTFMMFCACYILDTQRWSLDQQHRITWKLVRNGGSQAPPRLCMQSVHFNKIPRWLLCS